MAKKKEKKAEEKLVDGFVVDEQGLVEMRLHINLDEDLTIKVSPEVAGRLMDGEFEGEDPGDHDNELNINTDDLVNLRMSIESVYESRLPRSSFKGVETGATGLDGDDLP